jgi:hypothetical protein
MSITCDPASLMNGARCFQGLKERELRMITVYLLCQISNAPPAAGGGGASCLLCGSSNPVNPPPNNCPCAIFYNVTTQSFFDWTGTAWQAFISI